MGDDDAALRKLKRKMLGELLRPLAVFSTERMDEREFGEVVDVMRPANFAAGEMLYIAGDPADWLAVVVVGAVEMISNR